MRKLLIITATLAAGAAFADEPLRSADVGDRAYISILPSFALPDSKRGVDQAGAAASLIYGQELNDHFGVEINGTVSLFTTGRHNGTDFYQEGVSVDGVLNLFPRRDSHLLHPYFLAGVGGVYDDMLTGKGKTGALIADAGVGVVTKDLYHSIRFRMEGRYLHDFYEFKGSGFNDFRVSAGVEVALGSKTERHIELPPPKVEFREVVREVPRPFIDSDGDGVPDEKDKCPDTPRGMKVDSDGCIIPDQVIELRGVTFEFNKTRLSPNASAVLDAVVKAFVGQPSLRVEIGGHTDSIGSVQYNQKLSQGRAEAVRTYLIGAGARPEQITAVGYGKSRLLINPEKNDDDRELNRRVEFKVVGN